MEYIIENELLKVTVTTNGAQIKSVIRKEDGVEHIWQADPKVWAYHTPILFPHTGRLKNGTLTVDGKDYESKPHGFARCHNCYLVNLKYVERLDKGLCVVGGHCLAVSRPRQKSFMMELTRYVTGGRA